MKRIFPFQATLILLSLTALTLASCMPSTGIDQERSDQVQQSTPTAFEPKLKASSYRPLVSSTQAPPSTISPTITSIVQVNTTTPPALNPIPTIEINVNDPTILNLPDTITFLILGSDTRGGPSFRTDTMMVVILRPKEGGVSIISIPRDLWVNIPEVGEQRINVAYQYGELYDYPGGGPGLLKDTILYNLGIQIDHYAMVDFNGFRKIVDTIGGIEIPVFCSYTDWKLLDPELDPELEESWALYTVEPGLVKMDGDFALWYARSRKMSSDFDRGRRQQEVIRAIFHQGLTAGLLTRIPQLFSDLSSSITSDLNVIDIVSLAPLALKLTNADIRSYYIAGEYVTDWVTDQGAYILLPNTELINHLVLEAMSPPTERQEKTKTKVEVLNGSTTDGLEQLAAERLNYAGYDTVTVPFDKHDYTTTLVYDMTTLGDRTISGELLKILDLPGSALIENPKNNEEASYAVIIGNDYDACFKPSDIRP